MSAASSKKSSASETKLLFSSSAHPNSYRKYQGIVFALISVRIVVLTKSWKNNWFMDILWNISVFFTGESPSISTDDEDEVPQLQLILPSAETTERV